MTGELVVVYFNKVKGDSYKRLISVGFLYIYKQLCNFIIFNGGYASHREKENFKYIFREIAIIPCLKYAQLFYEYIHFLMI